MRKASRPPRSVLPRGRGFIALALFALWVGPLGVATSAGTAEAACPERPPCKGCGCKGGPGYRGPDGKCVGFKALDRVCGVPPETRCVFENAPGTGANHDCALAASQPKVTTEPPADPGPPP